MITASHEVKILKKNHFFEVSYLSASMVPGCFRGHRGESPAALMPKTVTRKALLVE